MVVMRIKGGLGNQLFQYSAGYALSKRLNDGLILDTSFFPKQTLRGYKLGNLKVKNRSLVMDSHLPMFIRLSREKHINKLIRLINNKTVRASKEWTLLIETEAKMTNQFFTVDNSKNVYVDGYYQSERYFKKYRTDLINQFTPKYKPSDEYCKALHCIKQNNSVAVHVRRGDFLNAQYDKNPRHYLLEEKYYSRALKFSDEKLDNPQYYWFSDDIEWVKKNFGIRSDFHFISLSTENPDIDEMMLMKNCNHIITANSTFSWWAAWLNENTEPMILCPSKPYGIPEMIPNDWIKIMVE